MEGLDECKRRLEVLRRENQIKVAKLMADEGKDAVVAMVEEHVQNTVARRLLRDAQHIGEPTRS